MPYKMLNVVATIALGWLVSTGFRRSVLRARP